MTFRLDARIPVIFGPGVQIAGSDAVLTEGESFQPAAPVPGGDEASGQQPHRPGCPCCVARTAAGKALTAMLQDRARGKIPYFNRVIALVRTHAGRAEIETALLSDPVAAACFRLEVPRL